MLNTVRQHGNLREYSLIGRTCHNLVGIAFTPRVRSNNSHCRSQELHKMPTCASDGEKISIIGNVAKDFECGVMLEQEVHFDANTTNILEHVAELHVVRIRPKPVKTAPVSPRLRASHQTELTYRDHQACKYVVFAQKPPEDEADQNDWYNNGNMRVKHPLQEQLSMLMSFDCLYR